MTTDHMNVIIGLIGLGQTLTLALGGAAVGWAIRISGRLSAIESVLGMYERTKDDSSRVHSELDQRLRKVENSFAGCPNCLSKQAVGTDA